MRSSRIALICIVLYLTGCKTSPVPPEIKLADEQELKLWRAGASVYTPREYEDYRSGIRKARRSFGKENLKLGWFRRYAPIREEFRKTLSIGDALLANIQQDKNKRQARIQEEIVAIRKRLAVLDDITLSVNERGSARRCLSKAGIMLGEAELITGQSRYEKATERLQSARQVVKEAENACLALLSRYMDRRQIENWKKMAQETVGESRKKGITVIVVSKLERKLIVFRKGAAVAEFEVSLGLNGLSDKLHSGDNATPEGRYKVTKKNPSSRYYKALLIDYPNEEDTKRFAAAKQKREIPYWVGIGSLVEIHGGGKDSLTKGCISVDDEVMDRLFGLVSVGTPVTIVGTLESGNAIFKNIRDEGNDVR